MGYARKPIQYESMAKRRAANYLQHVVSVIKPSNYSAKISLLSTYGKCLYACAPVAPNYRTVASQGPSYQIGSLQKG